MKVSAFRNPRGGACGTLIFDRKRNTLVVKMLEECNVTLYKSHLNDSRMDNRRAPLAQRSAFPSCEKQC